MRSNLLSNLIVYADSLSIFLSLLESFGSTRAIQVFVHRFFHIHRCWCAAWQTEVLLELERDRLAVIREGSGDDVHTVAAVVDRCELLSNLHRSCDLFVVSSSLKMVNSFTHAVFTALGVAPEVKSTCFNHYAQAL